MRFLLIVFLLAPGFCAGAAADPLTGEWVIDAAHPPQKPVGLRTETLRLQADGTRITLTETGLSRDGAPYTLKFNADCDGKVNGIIGSAEADAVQCWRNDPKTLVIKLLRDAAPREWRTAELAKNGQSMKVTSTAEDAKGKEEKSIATFLKK